MYRKAFFTLFFTSTFLLASSAAVMGQIAAVRGVVKVRSADGKEALLENAVVDVYRIDVEKGNGPTTTTNKRGQFTFAGLPLGQKFALAVSAPGVGPRIEPDVKPGSEDIVIIVEPGDGRKLTEADVREAIASAKNAPAGESSADAKKKQEEFEKQRTEIDAKNKKVASEDAAARQANAAGIAAIQAKDYDLAIAKFSEGVAAVPDFVGSTPILLNGKMIALKDRGYNSYREGAASADTTAKLAKYQAANKDYDEALAAMDQALTVIKSAAATTDPADQKNRAGLTLKLLSDGMEIHRLKAASGVDTSKTADAAKVINAYIAAEPDAAKKTAAQVKLGDIMRNAGEFDQAIAAYKSVLAVAPDDNEVMASLGLCLVALGTSVDPPNKEQLQEGLNYMQKYADTVTILPTDPKNVQEFKQSVKDTVEYLKTEQKLKPQASPKAAGGKRKTQ